MKSTKAIPLIVFAFITFKAEAQKPLLDSIIHIFQTQSIYRNSVNWDSLKPQLYRNIDYAKTDDVMAVVPAYVKLAKALNITHGGLNYKGKSYGAINKGFAAMAKRIPDTIRTIAQNKKYNFRTIIIDQSYGYISIPSVGIQYSNDMDKVKQALKKKANVIQDTLCKLNITGLKGIILDLRLNGGGSSVAMIGGLNSLYNEGLLFSFVMAGGKEQKVVKAKDYIIFNKDTLVKLKSKCPRLNKVKLAVLISPYTTSAGEQIAISLEGRKNTIFIGERSRGMTTGIETIPLRKNLILDYATSYIMDRYGNTYTHGVVPDLKIIGKDQFKDLQNDPKVQAALRWFTQSQKFK